MTSPRGTPPFDLRAIEREQAALQEEMRRPPGATTLRQEWEAHHVGPMLGLLDRAEAAERNVTALLAHCRALRAALREAADEIASFHRNPVHLTPQGFLARTAAVLAQAQDGPA